jgi:hypothetical protein
MSITEEKKQKSNKQSLLFNNTFHKFAIALIVLVASLIVVVNGAEPKKYQLNEGDKSNYTITAPREIMDKTKTKENQEAAAARVTPKYTRDESAVNKAFEIIDNTVERVQETNAEKNEPEIALSKLKTFFNSENIQLSNIQIEQLGKISNIELENFGKALKKEIKKIMDQGITEQSLGRSIDDANQDLSGILPSELKGTGITICSGIISPNIIVDDNLTRSAKQEEIKRVSNVVKFEKGQNIVNVDDIITAEQMKLLTDLNMLKGKGKIDFSFYLGVLGILTILGAIFIIYLSNFQKEILKSRSDLILLGVIFILTLLMARGFTEISVYLIPFSFAAILISMLVNANVAVFMNLVLTTAIAIITKGDINFVYLSLIGGTFAAFAVNKADKRKKMVIAGIAISLVYGLLIAFMGIVNKEAINRILVDSGVGVVNGLLSIILAIGTLPFWESTFNIITPLKLLELSNPNQPLIKRLLLEAPGTYHHSLLVGNLAEVATEAIGGNDLLARVAAYYHDIGKLKRPYFFKENQYLDNPHERMTPSLSTLVITSHTRDGVELAEKYGIPMAIRDIILQHHGTTLVAYFFHKAKRSERLENQTKSDSFRYEGPRPTTKEAAVVMLADTVEAAVRSLADKTEGKIEGLVRKLIKDKLEDGQLDLCELTLKDLDTIARSFMKVFSGCFHGREEYPEIKNADMEEDYEIVDPLDMILSNEAQAEEEEKYEYIDSKQTEKI